MADALSQTETEIRIIFALLIGNIPRPKVTDARPVENLQRLDGKLLKERRGDRAGSHAANGAHGRLREQQALLRPRDADEAKPALLLQLLVVFAGARVRKDPIFHSDHRDHRELKPLGSMQGHERDRAPSPFHVVGIAHQADDPQVVAKRTLRIFLVVLGRGRNQLVDVGKFILLVAANVLEKFLVPALAQYALDKAAHPLRAASAPRQDATS